MKLTSALFALLSLTPVAQSSWLDGKQVAINDGENVKVPGENPLTFCSKPDDDILTIKQVDLDPNPPVP